MPWKNRTAETKQRVRENQRRSRARRDELLRDLQQRLDEHERLGFQATLEMQQAALQVARENESLRTLLLQKGVSDAEVAEFLRHGGPTPVDDIQLVQTRLPCRARATTSIPRVASVTALLNPDQPKTPPAYSRLPETLPRSPPRTNEGISQGIEPPATPSLDDTPASTAAWPSTGESTPLQLPEPDIGRNSGMETSCDVAAAILANMQGHEDTSRARVVLGCTSPSNCIVKNTRVFDLLDEAG
ncbi:hypothetical protein CONLIGDRAFT_153727 [Coniochaeta ligniaria NRRL 30616]|uniref:BZIP domain-containing protein n=1 Tax=Coniochaeta ligniaria NRRL 30616 TaxID=1408157 RepID=A0A1J7JTW2_9PEZI|nr:hypothetical protein CONLIGDRAFT_153727 [Coniochaeta ligniaria NRRL 30616]